MILNPLRFKTAQDVDHFIKRLQMSGLISIETKEGQQYISSSSYLTLGKNLLKANENAIYFLDDVQQFLKNASSEEINASTIVFSSSTIQKITLAEIKEHPKNTLSSLQWSAEPLFIIKRLNPAAFSTQPFPVLTTAEDIKKARTVFDNSDLYFAMNMIYNNVKFIEQLPPKSLLKETEMSIPIPSKVVNFINYFNIDILKITLIQEIKLKSHLLNQMNSLKNQQEKDMLNQWIKVIDENNLKTKTLFKLLINFTKYHHDKTEVAKLKYQQIITSDPTLEKTKNQIADLISEAKIQKKQLKKQQSLFNILKPLAVYSLLIGLPIVAFSLSLTLLVFLAPVLLPPTLIACGLTLLLLGTLMLTTSLGNTLTRGISNIKKSIEEKFSLEEKLTKIEAIKAEYEVLQSHVNFATEYSKVEKELDATDKENNAIKITLDTNLLEINGIEVTEQLKSDKITPDAASNHSINDVSLFRHKRSDSDSLPSFNQKNDEQEHHLKGSSSF